VKWFSGKHIKSYTNSSPQCLLLLLRLLTHALALCLKISAQYCHIHSSQRYVDKIANGHWSVVL